MNLARVLKSADVLLSRGSGVRFPPGAPLLIHLRTSSGLRRVPLDSLSAGIGAGWKTGCASYRQQLYRSPNRRRVKVSVALHHAGGASGLLDDVGADTATHKPRCEGVTEIVETEIRQPGSLQGGAASTA